MTEAIGLFIAFLRREHVKSVINRVSDNLLHDLSGQEPAHYVPHLMSLRLKQGYDDLSISFWATLDARWRDYHSNWITTKFNQNG